MDIDKLYIMGYNVNDNGNIQFNTKSQNRHVREIGLQNKVVDNILKVTRSPKNQINLHMPIDMGVAQKAAEGSAAGEAVKHVTADDPFVKYMMQVQNMVGKQVIGITAVSIKAFFAATTHYNNIINNFTNDLIEEIRKNSLENFSERYTSNITSSTAQYGVIINPNLHQNANTWLKENPNGIVAYRKYGKNPKTFTSNTVNEKWIGNPFSTTTRDEETVKQFYEWLVTGNNFGNELATEEFRQAIISKIMNSPEGTPILYYKELGRPSHATIIGYLINHKELLSAPQTVISTVFTTSTSSGYPQRTKENVDWSDVTIAFASNFKSSGETLTAQLAGSKDKFYLGTRNSLNIKDKYVPVDLDKDISNSKKVAENIFNIIKSKNLPTSNIKLNIAGNGIYTLKGKFLQRDLNIYITNILRELQNLGITISEIRSGGQTGADEAGIIAAQRLGIPSSVRAPADWRFRGINGIDVSDEVAFKERFNTSQQVKKTYDEILLELGNGEIANSKIQDAVKFIPKHVEDIIYNNLKEILLINPLSGEVTCYANLNFDKIIDLVDNNSVLKNYVINRDRFLPDARIQQRLARKDNNPLTLSQLLHTLRIKCMSNDATLSLSALLSAATDARVILK